ncbi:FAD-dependent oxidoreductase [Arthrobacter sp. I2-34]|uniref:FAD-dependent oxidoreductase n=1 Tax=Arthrobacter hankyongi TaxID=2904801 RepID=A0ABS9LC39_9MICC|nr:FAD-dependent oxidoreductase [Arthrobacter hankyongi]MCG2624029.1 FAD-dependent oxidoreductase [Arthrobacter hankyongi]
MSTFSKPHVLILGGGYAGLYTAWGLEKRLGQAPMDITLVEPNSYMTYQPLLPEVAGGEIDPRTVMVELRRVLKHTDVFRGKLESLDCRAKTATLASISGERKQVSYDHVVFALGAITRTFPTPGLAEQGVGFKTLEEALYVRDKVLDSVALAAATSDPAERAKALTVVFVGGGYTGVEALTELLDLAKLAVDEYPDLKRTELRWVLIEALDRVAPEIGPGLSKWTLEQLRRRGVDVRLNTTMKSCVDGQVVLSTGEMFPAGTIVWTAGVKPNPVLAATNVPRGPKGHVSANARLQVVEDDGTVVDGAWAAGDNAQVPDLTSRKQPAWYSPNAQNAVRQARLLADNIVAALQQRGPAEYRHTSLGAVASFGVGRGAAVVKGIELKGRLGWIVDRLYHGAALPTMNRKWKVFTSWASGAFAAREVTSVSSIQDPREAFLQAVDSE